MDSIGKRLHDKRLQMNKSIEDIHSETKVSIAYLTKLESNDFEFLPPTYIRSYLKTYAKALNLDSESILKQYSEISGHQSKSHDSTLSSEEGQEGREFTKSRLVEWGLALGTLALLGVMLIAYFEYKALILAEPVNVEYRVPTEEFADIADISVKSPATTDNPSRTEPFSMYLKARKKIWLGLKIDNYKSSEYTLSPEQELTWLAKERFDIQIRYLQRSSRLSKMSHNKPEDVMTLTITRDAFKQ